MTQYHSGNLVAPAAAVLRSNLDDCRRTQRKPPSRARSCPIRETLEHLGSKWTVLILIALSGREQRFNELRREIPDISQRMLTQTLRELERAGLVHRDVHATIPPRVEYRLSALGQSLLQPLAGIVDWTVENVGAIQRAKMAYDLAQEGGPPPLGTGGV